MARTLVLAQKPRKVTGLGPPSCCVFLVSFINDTWREEAFLRCTVLCRGRSAIAVRSWPPPTYVPVPRPPSLTPLLCPPSASPCGSSAAGHWAQHVYRSLLPLVCFWWSCLLLTVPVGLLPAALRPQRKSNFQCCGTAAEELLWPFSCGVCISGLK